MKTNRTEVMRMKDEIMKFIENAPFQFAWYKDIEHNIYGVESLSMNHDSFRKALYQLVHEGKLIENKSPYGWSYSFEQIAHNNHYPVQWLSL